MAWLTAVSVAQWQNIGARIPKTWGWIPHGDLEFLLFSTHETRRKTSFFTSLPCLKFTIFLFLLRWCLEHRVVSKPLYGPKWPMGQGLNSGFLSMKRLGVLLFPPGWAGSPSQGYPQHICWYPFVHMGEEKHCESKVSCLRTQHNDPDQASIWSQAHQPWGHRASTVWSIHGSNSATN